MGLKSIRIVSSPLEDAIKPLHGLPVLNARSRSVALTLDPLSSAGRQNRVLRHLGKVFALWLAIFSLMNQKCFASDTYPIKEALAQFSLAELKLEIAQDPTVMRAAFPEAVFKQHKFIKRDLSDYFKEAFPLVSLHAIKTIINNDIGEDFIIPLEQVWLWHHRALHELIKAHAIEKALAELTPSPSQIKIWRNEYIFFFFAPTASLTSPEGVSPWSSCHYRFENGNCPAWLKQPLAQAFLAHSGLKRLYKKMDKINKQLNILKSQETINRLTQQHLQNNRYATSLAQLGDSITTNDLEEEIKKIIKATFCACIMETYINQDEAKRYAQNLKIYDQTYLHDELVSHLQYQSIVIKTRTGKKGKKSYFLDQSNLRKKMDFMDDYSIFKPDSPIAKRHVRIPQWLPSKQEGDELLKQIFLKQIQKRAEQDEKGD